MINKALKKVTLIVLMIYSTLLQGFYSDNGKCVNTHCRLIKLHYDNQSGEKGLTTFKYNEEGKLHKAYWELLDGSRYSNNFYSYDDKNRLIKKYREFSDGIISTELYEYDPNGNLIAEYFNRSDSVTGITKYKYEEKGRVVQADCEGLAGWFYGIIKYEYDENGLKIKGIIEKDGEPIGSINYEYDHENNLVLEHWDFINSWSQTFKYEYEIIPG